MIYNQYSDIERAPKVPDDALTRRLANLQPRAPEAVAAKEPRRLGLIGRAGIVAAGFILGIGVSEGISTVATGDATSPNNNSVVNNPNSNQNVPDGEQSNDPNLIDYLQQGHNK